MNNLQYDEKKWVQVYRGVFWGFKNTPLTQFSAQTLYNMQKHKTECDLYCMKLSQKANDIMHVK